MTSVVKEPVHGLEKCFGTLFLRRMSAVERMPRNRSGTVAPGVDHVLELSERAAAAPTK